jgi:hypothetical protein
MVGKDLVEGIWWGEVWKAWKLEKGREKTRPWLAVTFSTSGRVTTLNHAANL